MIEVGGLISTILGFGAAIAKDKMQRHELVIKLLKQLNLNPDHPPADFTAVYQYALVEYGIGKPQPVLEIFRQPEIQQFFRRALDQNNPAILFKAGEEFLANHVLGDELQTLGMSARREFYQFAAVFIEIAKRTRTPAEVLTNQRLESLHRQIGTMQERLNRLPTLEGIRTEMARLAEQDLLALPSETNTAKQCRAFALAQQMRGWFETLGYRFEKYEVWQDDYFEWIINVPVRRNRFDRILVRGIEGEAGLRDVMALRQSVETQQTDEGWLVTARRISRAARDEVEKPENRHLDCYTFDELVDLDADFSGYIEWLEAEIRQRGVATQYVPLACTKEELDPVTKQRITVSRYDERDGWIDGYCDRWLDDSAKEHISVLGEFGTGKTWFAFHYAWVALQRYQAAKDRGTQRPRLPLVITLRDYAKALNVENVLAGFFFTQHNIRLNSEVFDQLNRMGKLLLIFDGFDEMAAKVDKQQMINNFWELAKVVVPGAKVILTCRTEHFPEAQDGRALLNAELQASTANLTGETPQFEVLELEKFTDDQIRQVFSFQTTPATVEQVMGNPQLLDLARRPVMTELILEALPDIEAGKPVDMSRVYLYAVRRKMERDIKAERTFTSLADKLYFLCELSWEMLSTNQMSLNYREFPDRIRKLFGAMVQEEKDLDHWHYDMMGQTMLIRNADGDYAPAHRSLLEFFVAYKFAAELGALAPDFLELAQMRSNLDTSSEPKDYTWSEYFHCEVDQAGVIIPALPLKAFTSEPLTMLRQTFGQSSLTKVLIELILPILDTQKHFIRTLEVARGKTKEEVGFIGGNSVNLLLAINKTALIDKDLSRSVILNADFSNAILHHTNFTEANLSGSTFTKDLGRVLSVVYSSDGKLLATGDSYCAIRIWEVSSGREVLTCREHIYPVRSVAFHPNAQVLASGSVDRTVKLWDINTDKCLKTFQGHTDQIDSVSFNLDGTIIASSSEDTTIRLWDTNSGTCLHILRGHTHRVSSIAFNPTKRILVSGSNDGTLRLWNVDSGECLIILQAHTLPIRSVVFSSNGELMASGSYDSTVKIWNIHNRECLKILLGHTDRIYSVTFSSDSRLLASSGCDRTVCLWDVQTGHCLKVLKGHTNWVSTVSFSPDDTTLASGSYDATVRLWNVSTSQCLNILQGHDNQIRSIKFSPNGVTLASGGGDQTVKLWDINSGECLRILQGHCGSVQSIAFNDNGHILASGSGDTTVRLWNCDTGECIRVLKGHTGWVHWVGFNLTNNLLISTGGDKVIKLWDINTGHCLRTFVGHESWILSAAFSPDNRTLATCSDDKTVKLWDIFTGKCLNTLKAHKGEITSLSFNAQGDLLASGGRNAELFLWNPSNGKRVGILRGHTNQVCSLAFNPKNNSLASGSDDFTIKLWDIPTDNCVATLRGHASSVYSVAFSPNGKIIASGSTDETIRIWSVEKHECLKIFVDKPYEGMDIAGVKGLTEAEKATLKALGAVEN